MVEKSWFVGLALCLVGCTSGGPLASLGGSTASSLPSIPITGSGDVKTADGLQYTIVTPGTGATAQSGDHVSMLYVGWLTNGTKFDSSFDHGGQPFPFQIGAGQVIKGWDEGVAGMKVGEVRKLVIPSSLGYGPSGQGPIPANATLIFEVQLVADNH